MNSLKVFCFWLIFLFFLNCTDKKEIPRNKPVDEIAGNEQVKEYMEGFEGRGIQTDSTSVMPAEETLSHFELSEGLAIDLVLSEPEIYQPVDISFDHRGRLWVVQYNQYPYPEGVKVVDIDNHNRVVFDYVPEPPADGIKGADKITIFEDKNGDGTYDKSTDAITGLNIATSVALGRGKIWVLTPPYLVAYPDPDGDGLPNGEPEVHLEGFGLEDTHAVANNLRWGPDGWLYGAQGSTTIANISSKATKDVYFSGQAIWRYHPESYIFEIFAEGGGNTFDVEFDKKGRVYSGDNGVSRGFNYKQGGYYRKNWGKHGALTNPYAFGFLPGMKLEGEKLRFTHAWLKYEENSLPVRYQDKLLAINPLHNFVRLTRLVPNGSTYDCIDEERVLQSDDHWFRPVDIKSGPDGGVYIADWSDSRLSHVNPRDNWDKKTGRIYRLRGTDKTFPKPFNISALDNSELVAMLSHQSKWYRQQALRQFGDRKDPSVVPELLELLDTENGQTQLEALWAINLSGGFNEELALKTLDHADPFVRLWTIRLIGDKREVSEVLAKRLADLGLAEEHPEVIGQLASSAKRLSAKYAIPIIVNLMRNENNVDDEHNLMFTWWALEDKSESGRDLILSHFIDENLWKRPVMIDGILERLIRRYAVAGGKQNYTSCISLCRLAPSDEYKRILFEGLQEGLRGKSYSELPEELVSIIENFQMQFGVGKWAVSLRQNDPEAVENALEIIQDRSESLAERLVYIKIFGEIDQPQSVPVLLKIASSRNYSVGSRLAAIQVLGHYNDLSIGKGIVSAYPFQLRDDELLRHASLSLLSSRDDWAAELLSKIVVDRQIKKSDFPLEIVKQLKLLENQKVLDMVEEIWPEVRLASSGEKQEQILRIKKVLRAAPGNSEKGEVLYTTYCGNCHKLKGNGGAIGPDLTGYERGNVNYMALNIVDPNADIREGYVNYRIKKRDGQLLVGVIVDKSVNQIVVRTIDGKEHVLSTNDVDEMTAQKESLMPEFLTEGMTDEQIRDLFAYLKN
ncbi:MAG: c-type cytochrome [Cyclobacteriaceae bacterium]